jgi:hypothetical protein
MSRRRLGVAPKGNNSANKANRVQNGAEELGMEVNATAHYVQQSCRELRKLAQHLAGQATQLEATAARIQDLSKSATAGIAGAA